MRLPLRHLVREFMRPRACYVLGAGASVPDAPLTSALPSLVRQFADSVNSYPGTMPKGAPLRSLLRSMGLGYENSLFEWKAGRLTEGAVALIIQPSMCPRPAPCPATYHVFRLIPRSATVVSFNWDGLAEDCCPQRLVLHPHGRLRPRRIEASEFLEWLDLLQDLEKLSAQEALGAQIVLPGEEGLPAMGRVHEAIFQQWLSCDSAIIVGFRIGLGSSATYDQIWRDVFVEALATNRVPVHIVAPDAAELAAELAERLGRSLDVIGWSLQWSALARLLLRFGSLSSALAANESRLWYLYDQLANA